MDVEQIANGLTKAQRDMFVTGTAIGCAPHSEATRQALVRRDLAVPLNKYQRLLDWTPLGLAVRAHLLASRGRA